MMKNRLSYLILLIGLAGSEFQLFAAESLSVKQQNYQIIFFPHLNSSQISENEELILDKQVRIYNKLKKIAELNPAIPVFVEGAFFNPDQSNFESTIHELEDHLSFIDDAEHEGDEKSDLMRLITDLKSGTVLSEKQIKFLSLYTKYSPFDVDGYAFEESQLKYIRNHFVDSYLTKDQLSETQRGILLRFGVVAVLAAKGVIKGIQKTDNLNLFARHSQSDINFEDSKNDLEKCIAQLIKDYQRLNHCRQVVLVYQKDFKFEQFFEDSEFIYDNF